MRARAFMHPRKNVQLGRAVRRWGQPHIPGRYRVAEAISGSVTPGRSLSRIGAIRTFQRFVKGL
ncbi:MULTISPECIES: hypothetical protein [Streptomyces]|uniref:Uncharacterized protein n=1 Tax=Streptomyces parvus TaxID=66428 RepID=A0A7K3S1P0_9ACTN|nr:hypothetical protein [Streptomyces parvus]NEC21203.1 hypothetical protein [Streptomyces parvus]NEE29347.1 hypothetical protein [Streptomyces sp. SID7982]